MNELTSILAEQIRSGGPLPFESFMEQALYHPNLGYYTASDPGGPGRDFFTSPLVSGAFGRTLARFLAAALPAGGLIRPGLVELGAGDGRLARDVLAALEPRLAIGEVHLVERNPERLAPLARERARRLLIHRDISEIPPVLIAGAVYANELVDALPVARLRRRRERIEKSHLTLRRQRLAETWLPEEDPAMVRYAREYLPAEPDTYRFEYPGQVPALLARVRALLRTGLFIMVDYGDLAGRLLTAERSGGTLRAFHRHRVRADLLADPGGQDLTADVNFSFLMDQARAAGFVVRTYQTQAQFLVDNGFLEEFRTDSSVDSLRTNLVLKQLLLPGGMGEVFKVLVLEVPGPGFSVES